MSKLHTFSVLAYKESPFLEKCLKSVINQKHPSKVIIVTTTPNQHINKLAKKYKVQIIIGKHTNIGGDFDFAVSCADTPLVTVAHQDDIYDKNYSWEIVKAYKKDKNSSIIFTDYYEIRNGNKIYSNTLLKFKRVLLSNAKIKNVMKTKFTKRNIIRFGNAICCPAVTFVKKNCPNRIFQSKYKANVDWHAWEKLSKQPHSFIFVPQKLMGHRISEESTTTEIVDSGLRTKEDFEIFQRFWPKWIAKILNNFYKNSEKSNKLA